MSIRVARSRCCWLLAGLCVLAVFPGKFGIALISPPLDKARNSVGARKAIADISNDALDGNPKAAKLR